MPYKVGRVSNSQSKGSGSREVVVAESVAENIVVENVVENVAENIVVESVAESQKSSTNEVDSEFIDVLNTLFENEVPPQSETPNAPLFNEDFSKVFNPLTNRYVKVGGDIDRKLNLSQRC